MRTHLYSFPVNFVAGKALGLREAYVTVSLRGLGRVTTVLHGNIPVVHPRHPGFTKNPRTGAPVPSVRGGFGIADEVAPSSMGVVNDNSGAMVEGSRPSGDPVGPEWSQVTGGLCFEVPSDLELHMSGPAVVLEGLPTELVDNAIEALPEDWLVFRRLPQGPAPAQSSGGRVLVVLA